MKRFGSMLAMLATIGAAPADRAPVILAPVGPWNVHYSENFCLLSRKYGSEGSILEIGFQPLFNASSMDVIMMEPGGPSNQQIGTGKLRFSPSESVLDGRYYSVAVDKGTKRYSRITVPNTAFALMQSSTEMTVTLGKRVTRVQLTRTDKAMSPFRKCESDLLKSWDVDPATVSLDRAAKPIHPERAFTADGYPKEALSEGFIGRVVTLVQVDATGTPTSCRVVAGAARALNEETCRRMMMRVKYDPGIDALGKPTKSIIIFPVRWDISG